MGAIISAGLTPRFLSESTEQRKGRESESLPAWLRLSLTFNTNEGTKLSSPSFFCMIYSHKMEAAFERLALPLLQVRARCKSGLKHLQRSRFLPAQDNISSTTSNFMSRHAQNCCDLSSLVQSSHLNPTEILEEVKEHLFSGQPIQMEYSEQA